MGQIVLSLLLVTVIVVAWIECYPDRLDRFTGVLVAAVLALLGVHWLPSWYGWVVLLLAAAQARWTYLWLAHNKRTPSPLSQVLLRGDRLVALIIAGGAALRRSLRRAASDAAQRRRSAGPVNLRRHLGKLLAAAALVLTSPVAAIPWALLLALLLAPADPASAQSVATAASSGQQLRPLLGTAFVVWITALDLAASMVLISVPVLMGAAVLGVAVAQAAHLGALWIRYALLWLVLGAAHPGIWLAAELTGTSTGPVFN